MFLGEPPQSQHSADRYQEDIDEDGFVWTLTRLWAWNPEADEMFGELVGRVGEDAGLSFRDRGVLVSATASAIRNSGCALAWGNRLSSATDIPTAISVINGRESDSMIERDRVFSRWARKVASDPTSIEEGDVQELRNLGLDDSQIFSITLYVALRVAYSTLNDALNAPLDRQLVERLPTDIVNAVDFGRPPL